MRVLAMQDVLVRVRSLRENYFSPNAIHLVQGVLKRVPGSARVYRVLLSVTCEEILENVRMGCRRTRGSDYRTGGG
jgi:hypothetical protein